MRAWIWLPLSVALVALAGCTDDDAPDDDTTATGPAATATPPAAIHEGGSLVGVGDPSGAAFGTTGCELGDQGCAEYTFALEDEWTTTLTLVSIDGTVGGVTGQVLFGADYDLFLRDSAGNQIGESTNPGDQDDVIKKKLQPGTYTVLVMAWNDQDGSYTLDIEFS